MIRLDETFLRGAYTPLVTPLRDGQVDYERFAALVDFQARAGSHGIVVCGTSGEPTTLTLAERMRLVEVGVAAAARRLHVIAATGSQSFEESLALTTAAERAGADGLLVVTPYFVKPPARGLAAYYAELGSRTRLPLLIYHIPARTGVTLDLATVERVAERVPHLVGIKHASTDLAFVTELLGRLGAEFRVFAGLEELAFPMLALGAAGVMSAIGNLVPDKVAALCEETHAGALAAARRLHAELFELSRAVFFETNPIPIKYMMKRIGLLAANEHRLPLVPAPPELEERLDGVLRRAGLL